MTINNQQCQLCRCVDVKLRLSSDYWVSGDFLVIELGMLRTVNIGEASITVLWPQLAASQPPLSGSCSRHCPRETAASIWMMNGGCRSAPAGTIFSLSSPCLFTRDNVTTTQHSLVFPQRTDWRICEMFIFAKWQSIRWLSGSELEFHWFPVKFSVISVKIEAPSVTDKTEIEGH